MNDLISYSRRDAALQLGISTSTLDLYIARGDLKARRRGGRVFISRAELVRFTSRDVPPAWPAKENGKTVRQSQSQAVR